MSSEDMIVIEGLRVFGRHGLHPWEKETGRVFVIDLECILDLEPAGQSDSILHTVDYHALVGKVQNLVSGESFDLIETLAERIAAVALGDDRVDEVTVRVSKTAPPVGAEVDSISVEIRRRR